MSPVSTARAAACAHAQTTAAGAPLEQLQGGIACLLNHERRAAGLGDLVLSRRLEVAGRRHARDMRAHDYFGHTSRDGRTFVDRIRAAGYLAGQDASGWTIGETIAWAHEAVSDPAAIVAALMRSPPHRRVILDGRLREVGIGIVRGTPTPDDGGVTLAIDYGSLVSPAAERRAAPRETTAGATKAKANPKPRPAPTPSGAADPPQSAAPAAPAERPDRPDKPGKDDREHHGRGK